MDHRHCRRRPGPDDRSRERGASRMVSRRIALALLRVASRRWPAAVRDDLHREWQAELHVLAAERRGAAMLRYAASLAVARPVREPMTVAERLGALWRAFRLVVVAPLAATVLLLTAMIALQPVWAPLSPWTPLVGVLATAVVLAVLGRWWTVRDAGVATVIAAVTVPGLLIGVLLYLLPHGAGAKLPLHGPAYVLFFGGLAVLLAVVNRPAAAGRRGRAWWIGALGATLLADVATAMPVLLSEGDDPPLASAPLWLFAALNSGGFDGRMPGLTGEQIFLVGDAVELDPIVFLSYAGLALGVILARRGSDGYALRPVGLVLEAGEDQDHREVGG